MKILLILAAAMAAIYITYRLYRIAHVDDRLRNGIPSGALILDVRTPNEFKTGHIAGAVNISLGELRTATLPFDNNAVIITCCSHGLRSVKAVEILNQRGFMNACNGGAITDLEQQLNQKN